MSQIIIKKPVSFLNRNIQFDLKDFFTQVTAMSATTAIQVASLNATGTYTSIVRGITGISKTVSLDDLEVEELAWMLIVSALLDALGVQLENFKDLFQDNNGSINSKDISKNITEEINKLEITLTDEFFNNPQQLEFLGDLQPIVQEWLQQLGLNESQAKAFHYQLKLQFAMSLHKEWSSNGLKYAPIIENLVTPFSVANTAQRKALEYRLWLQQEVNKRMFDEAFGLQNVYIPLRAYYCQAREIDNGESGIDSIGTERNIDKKVVMLHEEIDAWLTYGEPQDSIRVISGGPGSGKSSFAKILASNLAKDSNIPILFIPLHHFHLNSYLPDAINQFVANQPILKDTNLTQESDLLIIFDGLDELAMQNTSTTDASSNFIDELTKALRVREGMHWRAIVTGRDLSIQSQQHKLKKLKTIYHLLPYFVNEDDRTEYEDENDLLENDQRNDWWQNFGNLKGENFDGLPEDLATKHLEPITTEPLLNYLVSLSYLRQDIEFTEDTNLNEIYADLLDSVHERKYSQSGTHSSVNDMDKKKFIRILQEIALTVWHQSGRTATVAQITEQCEKSGIDSYFNVFTQDAKSGVIRLLMAFYFKKFEGGSGDETFEFTHKSFGEYLVAKRIMLELSKMLGEVNRNKEEPDVGLTLEGAFEKWIRVCGQQRIDDYLREFLKGEIQILANRPDGIKQVEAYQKLLIELIQMAINEKTPVKKLMLDSFDEDLNYSRNSEIALLELHSLCGKSTNKVVDTLRFKYITDFLKWINRIDHRVNAYFNHMHFEECVISASFLDCDFSYSVFENPLIILCTFSGCNLDNLKLNNASFSDVYIINSSMTEGDSSGSEFFNTSFSKCCIKAFNFRKADFHRVRFDSVNLENANFEGTNHENAIFTGANLKGTILEDLYPPAEEKTQAEE